MQAAIIVDTAPPPPPPPMDTLPYDDHQSQDPYKSPVASPRIHQLQDIQANQDSPYYAYDERPAVAARGPNEKPASDQVEPARLSDVPNAEEVEHFFSAHYPIRP